MKKILIAEDEKDIRFILKEILEYGEYILYEAGDGKEALDMSLSIKPDILILDVMMPQMTGYEVAEALIKKRSKCTIIMLSAKAQKADVEKGLKLGVDYYIKKPFDVMELRDLVDSVCAN